ncbi:class I SAM-dependent methyltransferase [Chloroflexota bacterium]
MMKQRTVQIIMRWPAFYRVIRKIYWTLQLQHLTELLIGTKAGERRWATRSIAKSYWDNRDHRNTHFLCERIATFSPAHSIFEVGCASGPNLYLLAKRFPQAQITGVDINQAAIEYGNVQFAHEGISNVKLLVRKADELGEFQDRAFDITFTSALLIYIGPDRIKEVIKGMIRITQQALVLMELHRFEPNAKDAFGLGIYWYGNWLRDYVALLKQFVPEEQIRVTKIPEDVWPGEPWKELGAVIEVDMR